MTPYIRTMAAQLHPVVLRRRCVELADPELDESAVDTLIETLAKKREHFSTPAEARTYVYAALFLTRLALKAREKVADAVTRAPGRPNSTALRDLVLCTIAESMPGDKRQQFGWQIAWWFGVCFFGVDQSNATPQAVRHQIRRRQRLGVRGDAPDLREFLRALKRLLSREA